MALHGVGKRKLITASIMSATIGLVLAARITTTCSMSPILVGTLSENQAIQTSDFPERMVRVMYYVMWQAFKETILSNNVAEIHVEHYSLTSE